MTAGAWISVQKTSSISSPPIYGRYKKDQDWNTAQMIGELLLSRYSRFLLQSRGLTVRWIDDLNITELWTPSSITARSWPFPSPCPASCTDQLRCSFEHLEGFDLIVFYIESTPTLEWTAIGCLSCNSSLHVFKSRVNKLLFIFLWWIVFSVFRCAITKTRPVKKLSNIIDHLVTFQ